jgi:hypothetical protein
MNDSHNTPFGVVNYNAISKGLQLEPADNDKMKEFFKTLAALHEPEKAGGKAKAKSRKSNR